MKKALLCICLLSMFLHGCTSNETQTQERTVLNVAIFDGGFDSKYWYEIADRFEGDHPFVDVHLDISENIGNILLPRIAGNTLPDVIYLSSSNGSMFTQTMMKEEHIASLSDVFTPQLEEQFMQNVLDNFAIRPYADKEIYLAPLYFNVTGLWYNQSLFDQYGYVVPTTWDEFFALGDQAKEDGMELFIYQGMVPTYLEALLWPMLAEKIGLDNLDTIYQNKKDAWLQPGVLEVLSTFERLKEYMQGETISLTYMEAQRRFMEGEALFIPCGNWLEEEMQEQLMEDDDLRFTSVPTYEVGANRYATIVLEQMYIPKKAKEMDLAKEFIAYQYESEHVVLNQNLSGGVVPIMQENTDMEKQPFQIFQENVMGISANFSPLLEVDMNYEVFEQISKILAGECTAQEVVAYLNSLSQE